MGWRFRRSIRIAPGVRVNFGKSGFTSFSVGGRGARATFGKRGITQSFGLPGTGLSYTQHTPARALKDASAGATPQTGSTEPPLPDRFGITRQLASPRNGYLRGTLFTIASLLVVFSFPMFFNGLLPILWPIALVCSLVALVLQSPAQIQAQLDAAHNSAIRSELEQRLERFRAAAKAAGGDPVESRRALALRETLDLTEKEVGYGEVERLGAEADLLEFRATLEAQGGTLTPIHGYEHITAPEACYFAAAGVCYDKRGDNDPTGEFFLTDEGVMFVAPEGLTSAPWAKTLSIRRERRMVAIQRRDRQTPLEFYFSHYRDAYLAAFIAERLYEAHPKNTVASKSRRSRPQAR